MIHRSKRRAIPNFQMVSQILSTRYRDFNHHNVANPLWELIFVLCSTQTNEANYRRAYAALRRQFKSLGQLTRAKRQQLEMALRPGGLAPRKAREIQGILKAVIADFGKPTLAALRRMSDRDCERYLTGLPGIGPKLARCVMMYSLGRMVFPVDVHCWRISHRLGWIRRYRNTRNGQIAAMLKLESKIPPRLRYSLHVNLISLGREYCGLKTRCDACPLVEVCPKIGITKKSEI
jgi:endonuclease III